MSQKKNFFFKFFIILNSKIVFDICNMHIYFFSRIRMKTKFEERHIKHHPCQISDLSYTIYYMYNMFTYCTSDI